ncbi:hypothetical protein Hamer_G026331 [Homarus americanus]|uniref:Uncharacterized protein n=2 Tax=Homarus americanus TaxID=6706 RepID=A0A8J5TNI4_HOMAM|nr:hypothetical protein Hamer_G026331 [Homarus americanus]
MMAMVLTVAAPTKINTSSSSSRLVVGPKSPYCRSQESGLVCNFTDAQEPVYVQDSLFVEGKRADLSTSRKVEMISPPILHLPDVTCVEKMSIRNTYLVLVTEDKATKTESCTHLQELLIFNSTVTSIPSSVTHLTVVSSKVTYLDLPLCIQRASLINSHIKFFRTSSPLRDAVVNVASCTIDHIEELRTSANAMIHFLTTNITSVRMENVKLGQNTTLDIRESGFMPINSPELGISSGVKVILNNMKGKLTVIQLAAAKKTNAIQHLPAHHTTYYLVGFIICLVLLIVLFCIVVCFKCIKYGKNIVEKGNGVCMHSQPRKRDKIKSPTHTKLESEQLLEERKTLPAAESQHRNTEISSFTGSNLNKEGERRSHSVEAVGDDDQQQPQTPPHTSLHTPSSNKQTYLSDSVRKRAQYSKQLKF